MAQTQRFVVIDNMVFAGLVSLGAGLVYCA